MQARTLYDKLVDAHTVRRLDDGSGPRRQRPALRRSHRAQRVHQPAGLQRPARGRAAGLAPEGRPGGGRSRQSHGGPARRRHARSGRSAAGRVFRRELPGFRDRAPRRAAPAPGHRARGRPRAGLRPARHDRGGRRQPHHHLRGAGRPRLRHRHLGHRALPRHPDPGVPPDEDPAGDGLGRLGAGRHRQGRGHGPDPPDRRRRGDGLRGRVRRPRHRGPVRRGAHDDLQHGRRVRRPRRRHGPRPDRASTTWRTSPARRRAPSGRPPRPIGGPCAATPGPCSTARSPSTRPRSSRWSPGAPARTRPARSTAACPIRRPSPIRPGAGTWSARWPTWT